MNKALVLSREQERFEEEMKKLGLTDLELYFPKSEKEIEELIAEADIILAIPFLIKPYLNKAKKLKWMQSIFAGVDALNDPHLTKDYLLTNVKDVYGPVMAEFVLGYILMFEKNILENLSCQENRVWNQKPYTTLDGKVLGVMGTGSIGKVIGKVAAGFGMKVLGFRNEAKPVDSFEKVFGSDELHEFLENCDYVVNVLPKTPETDSVMNYESFSHMKKSAVFMNLGRGSAVNEEDLVRVMEEELISAAVLDVFNVEPLPKESPLWSLKNVYVTPHVSGYLRDNSKIFEIFADNYQRFVQGEKMLYEVDLTKGY